MTNVKIDDNHQILRIRKPAADDCDAEGRLMRFAAADTEKLWRKEFVGWPEAVGLEGAADRISNLSGIWKTQANADEARCMGLSFHTIRDRFIHASGQDSLDTPCGLVR
jgi:beta-ureidopropionase / N-carbamoyl-L-amino-acid hydrolase